jgi:endonuclease/exonuclease/phosphatase family metal-dependent hydrolase
MLVLAALASLAACREAASALDAAPDSDGFPYPPPRTDVVPAVGSPDTLEIAAWNIENFPAESHTPGYVADLITSLDLDVIVVEEIASETAWHELLDRLREHEGILSTHVYNATDYQKIGVIYRSSMVKPGTVKLLFQTDAYAFPRPLLSVPLTIDDHRHPALQLEVIGVHFKAGVSDEDGARRRAAVQQLDAYLRAQANSGGEDEVIVAGDYNEVINTPVGQANLAPFLTAPDHYTVRTQANSANNEISFVPSSRLLDHITTTVGLADEFTNARVVIPRLQTIYSGYVDHVSDHLPIVLVVPFPAP